MDCLTAIIGGAAGAALINGIFMLLSNRQKHKQQKEDTETKDEKITKAALKYLLLDSIQNLGMKYIEQGEVTLDDRRNLNERHKLYHEGLGGNGDLDKLMQTVNELPLKLR